MGGGDTETLLAVKNGTFCTLRWQEHKNFSCSPCALAVVLTLNEPPGGISTTLILFISHQVPLTTSAKMQRNCSF